MKLESGTELGPYTILDLLGVGGMGHVYRARDSRLDRTVAIKVLNKDAATDRVRLQRFTAEARAVSALNHPNILTLHEIGESEDGPYLVTELVQGSTIRDLVSRGPLEILEALDYAVQAADGLSKAHGSGTIHRDLKPENLMVTEDGFVKILDFGLAKLQQPGGDDFSGVPTLTATGAIVGTVGYVSPEQLHGEEATYGSDIFALGIVLYEMLTGKNPFRKESTAATLSAIVLSSPQDPSELRSDLSPELCRIVSRVLAKSPEDRYATAQELAADLRAERARLESGVHIPSQVSKPRTAWLIGAVAMGIMITVVAVLLVTRLGDQTSALALPANQTAVAVFPIQDSTGDPELERAGIGRVLTDGFVRILSDVPEIYVVSPIRMNEVAIYLDRTMKEAARDMRLAHEVSEEAQANVMLTGTLSEVGGTFVLDATLTDISSQELLGTFRAETLERGRIIKELTEQVGAELEASLGSEAVRRASIENVATSSLEAYTSFMRGRDLMEQGEWEKAVPELNTAIEKDEDMGLAWSFLACAYSFAGDQASSQAAQKKAEELLDRVNEKERKWILLNGTWVNTGNAAAYMEQAEAFIQDYPDDREGYYYAGLGAEHLDSDCETALEYYETAYLLTPTFWAVTNSLVDCNLKLGRNEEARQVLDRYLSLPLIGNTGREAAEQRLRDLGGDS